MIIHIAGRPLGFGPFRRQLCCWCGVRLIDVDLRLIAYAGEAPEGGCGFWKEGELVGVDGPGSFVVPHEDGADIPPECCGSPPIEPPQLRLVDAADGGSK